MQLPFTNKILQALKREKMGLSLIACALLVVVGISVLMIFYLARIQADENRSQGLSLTRLVAEIPYDRLSSIRTRNTLKNIFYSREHSRLAYIVLTDRNGESVAEVAGAGIGAPKFEIANAPTQWTGERNLQVGNTRINELYAPILSAAEMKGYVRVGYFAPGFQSGMQYIPYIATIVLPVFLLTPIFYWLMRQEVKPLHSAQSEIANQLHHLENSPITISADGQLAGFMENFNRFIAQNTQRINCLESEKQQSEVSANV
ncbi:MAG: hypothetical protein KJO24_01530, partial [Gammaproteobacteria bacterium]|nr:hypothetical protein [Gammaproteobacteria bacterium]